MGSPSVSFFFFFNDTATTEIYTLSLHDALPILDDHAIAAADALGREGSGEARNTLAELPIGEPRSEEHTSELQSRLHLVCRLLLEKKKKQHYKTHSRTIAYATRSDSHHHVIYTH